MKVSQAGGVWRAPPPSQQSSEGGRWVWLQRWRKKGSHRRRAMIPRRLAGNPRAAAAAARPSAHWPMVRSQTNWVDGKLQSSDSRGRSRAVCCSCSPGAIFCPPGSDPHVSEAALGCLPTLSCDSETSFWRWQTLRRRRRRKVECFYRWQTCQTITTAQHQRKNLLNYNRRVEYDGQAV